jgi:hypothetical protein
MAQTAGSPRGTAAERPAMRRGRHTWARPAAPPRRAYRRQAPPAQLLTWIDMPAARPPAAGNGASAAPVPEVLGAGFSHDSGHGARERGRTGFERGGPADVLAPCSVLAELTGQAAGRMAELTDDELVGVMRAARRVQSWQVALELGAVRELAARRLAERLVPEMSGQPGQTAAPHGAGPQTSEHPGTGPAGPAVPDASAQKAAGPAVPDASAHEAAGLDGQDRPGRARADRPDSGRREPPGPRPAERAAAEIAAALTLTGPAADDWMCLAGDIERLEAVGTALAAGQIDLARARVFARELDLLNTLVANCVATSQMPAAPGLTTAQLRARLRAAVLAADPDLVRRRQAAAQREARVQIWGEASGNAVLAGRELPPAGALAADRHLTALALALKKAGAPGVLDEIRARVYLALLSGRDPTTVLRPGDPAVRQEPASAPGGNGTPSNGAHAAGAHAAGAPPAGAPSAGAPAAGAPSAGLPAAGPRPAGPLPAGAAERGAGAADSAADSASPVVQWPDGPRGTINLTLPLSAWLGLTNRPGQVAGYGPADAWTCRYLADRLAGQDGTCYCLTLTTPDGRPVGHACTTIPPPKDSPPPSAPSPDDRPGPAPPLPAAVGGWLGRLTVHWLDKGHGCDHALQTAAYRPGRTLAHLVRILNPTCTAPGCRRPAQQADLDHIQPYGEGGVTCSCNLHPACRHHHRLKQQPGWHVQMTCSGLTWTLPHGRSYPKIAEPYPV